MRLGIAEIGQQPIAEMLCDMTLMTFDGARTGILKRGEQVTVLLGIELLRKLGRCHEIAEHHREPAALRFMRGWCGLLYCLSRRQFGTAFVAEFGLR